VTCRAVFKERRIPVPFITCRNNGQWYGGFRTALLLGFELPDECSELQGDRTHPLCQQLKPLRHQLHRQAGRPGEIAAWPVEARDQPHLNRVDADMTPYAGITPYAAMHRAIISRFW